MHERVVRKIVRVHGCSCGKLERVRNLEPLLIKQQRLATCNGQLIQDDDLVGDKTLVILVKRISIDGYLERGFNVRIDDCNKTIGARGKALVATLGGIFRAKILHFVVGCAHRFDELNAGLNFLFVRERLVV